MFASNFTTHLDVTSIIVLINASFELSALYFLATDFKNNGVYSFFLEIQQLGVKCLVIICINLRMIARYQLLNLLQL